MSGTFGLRNFRIVVCVLTLALPLFLTPEYFPLSAKAAAGQEAVSQSPDELLSGLRLIETFTAFSRPETKRKDSSPVVLEASKQQTVSSRRRYSKNAQRKKSANTTALNSRKPVKIATPAKLAPPTPPAPAASRPRLNQPALSGRRRQLRNSIDATLSLYARRVENVEDQNCWEVMHWLIGYGVEAQVAVRGRPVNAIGWLCRNGRCKGTQLFHLSGEQLQARVGVGVQGHHGQFLAMLAQSNVNQDFPLLVGGRAFTLADLIEFEQENCRAGEELTFKLIAFSHYLPLDTQWRNNQGQKWDIPRLIQEELKQPVVGAACGGTHRVMGLSYAVRKRQAEGQPLEGQWKRAEKYIDDFQNYVLRLQNRDGSFSTDWFKGRADSGDIARKLQTTGHIAEWLTFSLPEKELHGPQMTKAIDFLASLMRKHSRKKWDIGPQGHAIRALRLYRERAFSEPTSNKSSHALAGPTPAARAR